MLLAFAGLVCSGDEHLPPITELAARTLAIQLGLQLGRDGYSFAGNYQQKGLYAYRCGRYAGMAFFGTGGTVAAMQAQIPSSYTHTYRPVGCNETGCECTKYPHASLVHPALLWPCSLSDSLEPH